MKRLIAVLLVFSLPPFFGQVSELTAASAEQAAEWWGICDTMFSLMNSDAVKNADRVLQRNLYTGTVNGMAFTVTDAGYDGHSLFLRYSFRIPDAKDGEQRYGVQRLLEALNASASADPEAILSAVKENIAAFTGGAEQFDDLTMLCVRWKGKLPG